MTSRQTVPGAALVAVTAEARAALGGKAEARIVQFPFKVGRENRGRFERLMTEVERRLSLVTPLNNLYLVEPASESNSLHISREHFAIDFNDGRYALVDRESTLGTIVGGTEIGSDQRARRADLRNGDLIVVGDANSPYVFRFQIEA